MSSDWVRIASSVYDLSGPRLLEKWKHFSQHYLLASDQGKYVLTCSPTQQDRMVKSYQFQLMAALRDNGCQLVVLPVRISDGQYCHLDQDSWWTLREYVRSDKSPQWESPSLIRKAAHSLAALHRFGRSFADTLRTESDRTDLGWYYLPAMRWPDESEEIARGFRWDELGDSDADFVRAQLDYVGSFAAEAKAECEGCGAISITHQDYRPVNIRIWKGEVAEVWDFDMAVIDFSLYDVAFASLQYGGRECLFPDISLKMAGLFLREYIAQTDRIHLFERKDLLHWFLVVVVLRRLLLNYHIEERVRLLRMVANWDWKASSV